MVGPILDYASSTWDPYTQSSINKLESVQYRAARFVTGDYGTTRSVSEMIYNLGWKTLQDRRTKAKMVMMYRIRYGLIDIFFKTILHPATLSTRVKSVRYLQPYCRTDTYRCTFFPLGIRQVCRHSTILGDPQWRAARSLLLVYCTSNETQFFVFKILHEGFFTLKICMRIDIANPLLDLNFG